MNRDHLQTFFAQPYDRAAWLNTIHGVFPHTELFGQPQPVPVGDSRAQSIFQLGNTRLSDDRGLAILEVAVVETTDLARNRVGLRNLVTRFIDQDKHHGVLAIFRSPLPSYRFTFVARETAMDEDGQIVKRETAPRRFTYLLGPGESCRTAAERFSELACKGDRATLRDLTDAFSVEKLNKEFFADYCRVFQRVHEDIRSRHSKWSPKIVEQQTQTLLNRLLFLCFVQRKGWLNRQRDYLVQNFRQHFDKAPNSTSYLDKFLRPVFEKLSTEGAVADIADHNLPFLNGGLFSDEYGAEHLDDTIRRHKQLKVGNATFQHVFDDLLEIYNFTIREDSPTDQEVAIDPEMLGKIFESLVLQIEKSDGGTESLRHDTGSHYTPRPIVHYLCTEGLRGWLEQFPPNSPSPQSTPPEGRGSSASEKPVRSEARSEAECREGERHSADAAWLTTNAARDIPSPLGGEGRVRGSSDWPSRLEKLLAIDASDGIDDAERAILDECLTPEEAKALLDRLDKLRACDPAVGSGAFPVGLLHELVNLMRLCETRSRGKDPVLGNSNWLYETKSDIIRHVIYGVDIQERAVEICKLRLWLSLMVDFDIGVDVDNCSRSAFRAALKNITPLPNLDYKIRRADSLIDQVCGHPVILPRLLQEASSFNDALNKLSSAKLAFYSAHSQRDKRKHHFAILAATADLALNVFKQSKLDLKGSLIPHDDDLQRLREIEQATTNMLAIQGQIRAARKLPAAAQDDELQRITGHFDDPAKPTFVWQLDFAEVFHRPEHPGFDLMIGNPPYGVELGDEQKERLKTRFAHIAQRIRNSYLYFLGLGYDLVRESGIVCYILPNEFLFQIYMTKARRFFLDNAQYLFAINVGEDVFDAIVPTCLVGFRKQTLRSHSIPVADLRLCTLQNLGVALRTESFQRVSSDVVRSSPNTMFAFDIRSAALVHRLTTAFPAFGDLCEDVANGICTSCDQVYIVSKDVADREGFENVYLKQCLRGGQMFRYYCPQATAEYVLYVTDNFDPKTGKRTLEYLKKHRDLLVQKSVEKKNGNRDWHVLFRPRYEGLFRKPKILIRQTADKIVAAADVTVGYYCINSVNVALLKDITNTHHQFILGLLNSSLLNFFYREISQEGGRVLAEVKPQRIRSLPIALGDPEQRAAVAGLVERVLAAKRADPPARDASANKSATSAAVAALEQEIDERVYRLYGLTKDEIKLVEGTAK